MEKNPLKVWRDSKEFSQEDLAKLVGVTSMTVSRWERGSHLPKKRHWPKIEEATGIVPSQLVEHMRTEPAE